MSLSLEVVGKLGVDGIPKPSRKERSILKYLLTSEVGRGDKPCQRMTIRRRHAIGDKLAENVLLVFI